VNLFLTRGSGYPGQGRVFMRLSMLAVLVSSLGIIPVHAPAEEGKKPGKLLEKGTVRFEPVGDQKDIPERYRLKANHFDYEMDLKSDLATIGVEVLRLRFPSPVVTEHKENNTVHAEYYRPKGQGPFPCAIVLDITGGDQSVSRTISTHLAQNKIAALF